MATIQRFVAPKFELLTKRMIEIPFLGNVANNGFLTIISGMITYPFRIICVKMIFIDAANNLVEHGWYTSNNVSAPLTGPPSDENIFGHEAPSALFYGRGIIRVVNTNLEYPEGRKYIKLYSHNTSGVAYAINCSIIIQEL